MSWNQPVIRTRTKKTAQGLCADFVAFLRGGGADVQEIFVLGADDPEMSAIEKLLKEHGKQVCYASCDGKRVLPQNANDADPLPGTYSSIVLIECLPKNLSPEEIAKTTPRPSVFRIDHHELGDPGFDLPPEQFWEASSIGQLYKLLNLGEPSKEHWLLAAMDHCPASAWEGSCPGITRDDAKNFEQLITLQRKGVDEVTFEECKKRMRELLDQGKRILIAGKNVIDTTGTPIEGETSDGYSLEYLCMKQVLAEDGCAALLAVKGKEGERERVIMHGMVKPEMVVAFQKTWAPENGLIKIFGAPKRGYAGGWYTK